MVSDVHQSLIIQRHPVDIHRVIHTHVRMSFRYIKDEYLSFLCDGNHQYGFRYMSKLSAPQRIH